MLHVVDSSKSLVKSQQEQPPNERLMLTWLKRDFATRTL
jgi:hypothetical protein